MSNITRFIPKAERIKSALAAEARQAVLDLGLPVLATEDIFIAIQRHETGGALANWTFNMISPKQCLAVWDAIENSDHPRQTDKVFKLLITHVETNTGIMTLTREEIASKVGIAARDVSRSMRCLEDMGVVFRERVKVPGMKGPGKARYRLNPHVAWNGDLQTRKIKAEQMSMPLEVIEGGKGDDA